jgi:hypothetical protein
LPRFSGSLVNQVQSSAKSLFTIFFVADFSAETGAGKAKSTAKASFGAHF